MKEMPKIKNISPFGDLDVPLLGRVFEHGSIIEVTDEQAAVLLMQEDNFQAWGPDARKVLETEKEKEGDSE
jgi:hypothetical protein